jgi:predicted MarR family transcription regulator
LIEQDCPRLERTRRQETILKTTAKPAPRKTGIAKPKNQPVAVEQPGSWHLARTETERRLSDFEFGLERLAQAYYRWKAACLAAVCDAPLTGDDVAVLNVVRMGDEPKRLSEIGQLLTASTFPTCNTPPANLFALA